MQAPAVLSAVQLTGVSPALHAPVPLLASLPLQTVDPSAVLDLPAPIKALGAFLASTVFGGAVIYRYGGRLPAAVDASTASLPLSAVYGMLAYGLVSFLIAYGYTQLFRLGVGAPALTVLGAAVLGGGLLALAGVGYVVVGAWLAELTGFGDPWVGLLGVGLVGAIAVLVLPLVAGVAVWFGIAAVGIGGPVRRWIHADAAERRVDEH
ncbi:hypothetical protein [Halobellus sp. GM3]|uniref:hypothetical protein n=1 Tax=Halobellus sp. GM3 TaxID=3458410 RepID=UPI00403D9A57